MKSVLIAVLAGSLSVALLSGCGSRAPHPSSATTVVAPLRASQADVLIEQWRARVDRYLLTLGSGGPLHRLADARRANSPRDYRPARITLGHLGDDADGWDVNGLLLGRHRVGDRDWYLFVVGTVKRQRYRPIALQDIRLAAMRVVDSVLEWQIGTGSDSALARYNKVFAADSPLRFPAIGDRFRIDAQGAEVAVSEQHSGARWLLSLPTR